MGPVGMDGANGVRAARCGGLAREGDGGRTPWAGGGGLRAERALRGGEWWVGWRLNEEREQVGVRESGREEQGQVGWGGEEEVGSAAEGRGRVSGAGGGGVWRGGSGERWQRRAGDGVRTTKSQHRR